MSETMRVEDLGARFWLKVESGPFVVPVASPVEHPPKWERFLVDDLDLLAWSNGLKTRVLRLMPDGSTIDMSLTLIPEPRRWSETTS